MTAFGPGQEPTERPASTGHPQHPNPAGQWGVPPQTDPVPASEARPVLPRAILWSLIVVVAVAVAILLVFSV